MGDDFFDILNLPTTAVRRMLRFLRYPDLRNVAKAIPSFSPLCDDEYRKVDRELLSRRDFKWTRFASSNDEESMAPRGLHSMAFHEKECAMYAFGGEAPDWRLQGDTCGPASFNDLWKLDMTSLKWSRVVVKSSPYPLPKYLCSMVVYKDELLIYGGCRPLPRYGSAMHLNEMHVFNTKKRAYRILVTTNDGPNLAGHASCMHGDLFIVHGGVVSTCEVSYRVSVLDMVAKRWFNAPLPGFPSVLHYLASSPIPSFMVGSSSLVVLKEGCLLATGENMRDDLPQNTSILFVFDPKDPEGVEWKYKLIPGIGRWWPPVGLSPPPSNKNFGGIAVMRCDRLIRLISLGMPQKGSKDSRCNITYDGVQKRSTNFIKHVRGILEAEMSRREQIRRYCRENDEGEAERSAKLSEVIENDGIKCTLGQCYLSTLEAENCKGARFATKPRTMDLVTIAVAINPQAESQRATPLDEVDVAELKLRLRTMIAQLHMKYYSTRPDVLLSPNLPSRNSSFRRMVAFTADIPIGEDFDPVRDLNRIEWIPQTVQYGGPPETRKYCIVAARGEAVVHGGSVHFGDGMGMMGYTYLMSPVATQPTMATPITNTNTCNRYYYTNRLVGRGSTNLEIMSGTLMICGIPEDLKKNLHSFRFSKSTSMNVLILKVDRETQQMILDETMEDCSIDDVREELPHQQPRFLLISYALRHTDGRVSYPMCLVFYSPPGCSPELQMMYAGSRNNLVQECELTKNFEIRDSEELTKEFLDSKLG